MGSSTSSSDLVKMAARRQSVAKADILAKAASAATKHARDKDFTDDQIALVTLFVATGRDIKSICRSLGAKERWGYAQMRRPEIQSLSAQTALTVLGLEAGRSIRSLAELRDTTASEQMRYQAAVELLDRAGLGNTTSARATDRSAGTHQFVFAPPAVEDDGSPSS